MLELQTGEFYGQLVDSDFSSFKAQIKAQETGSIPELVPVTTATPQEVKRNFMRIQDEIETVIASQQKGADVATAAKRTGAEPPATVERGHVNGKTRHNGQAAPGDSLDF